MPKQALSLWLMFGFLSAAGVVYIAVKANLDRVSERVEGSNPDQQSRADDFRAALAADSTNVTARIGLANILFDTGNWSAAAAHYRLAIAGDSSLVTAMVDLGVCHYNLGDAEEAERHFRLALQYEPHQTVALFNLGILYEGRDNADEALRYYHRALQTNPPEPMRPPIVEAIRRVAEQTGRTAKPLPDGN